MRFGRRRLARLGRYMRTCTAVAAVVLGGLAYLGVPTAVGETADRRGLMTATIGDFDCSTRTIPVTIDSSEVVGTALRGGVRRSEWR